MSEVLQSITTQQGRRRQLRRANIDRVLRLARKLPASERLLIEQVYRHGLPVAEVARLTGRPPRGLQRRVVTLLHRMRQPMYRFMVTRGELLPREVRTTAKRIVLEGSSLRRTSQDTGLSLHTVRAHMKVVETLTRM